MEELPLTTVKRPPKFGISPIGTLVKPLDLQFVDQRLELSVLLGGYIMTSFKNLRQLVSFCQQII